MKKVWIFLSIICGLLFIYCLIKKEELASIMSGMFFAISFGMSFKEDSSKSS